MLAECHTFNEGGFEVRGPYNLALSLHCFPALATSDNGLNGVVDLPIGRHGVGQIVGGGDAHMGTRMRGRHRKEREERDEVGRTIDKG